MYATKTLITKQKINHITRYSYARFSDRSDTVVYEMASLTAEPDHKIWTLEHLGAGANPAHFLPSYLDRRN
jgi:hypothetical protein